MISQAVSTLCVAGCGHHIGSPSMLSCQNHHPISVWVLPVVFY